MVLTHSLHQGFISDPNDDEQASPCDTVTRLCDSGAGTMLKFHLLLKIRSTYCVAFPFFMFLFSVTTYCLLCIFVLHVVLFFYHIIWYRI